MRVGEDGGWLDLGRRWSGGDAFLLQIHWLIVRIEV